MIQAIHCSQLARAMACPGSLFFKDLPKPETNDAAVEGTAAAYYLEMMLNKLPAPTHADNGRAIDDDMKYYGNALSAKLFEEAGNNKIYSEKQIDWKTRSGITIKGRYDLSFTRDGILYVDDYKYGFGVVEAVGNWQLIGYAIGEVIRQNKAFPQIVLRIHQPRAHHEDGPTREWRISYTELLDYKEKIEAHMESIVVGNNTLQSGDACKYCPAASHCPAFNKAYHRGVEIVHDFIQDNIDNDELGYQLQLCDRIQELLKTRKGSLEALAVDRIGRGQIIPGYIAEDVYGHRTWKKDISADAIKMMTGIDITTIEMLSPAQAEKRGVPKKLMESMTERKLGGRKLKAKNPEKVVSKIFGSQEPKLIGDKNATI
jgi:hypothetical protein